MDVAQLKRQQELLIEFLSVDLDLAFTFLQTAKIESGVNGAHSRASLARVEAAFDTLSRLSDRVQDPDQRRELKSRIGELEEALASFRP